MQVLNAAIIARVSTGQQEDGTSLEIQLDRCIAKAESLGYVVHPDFTWREVWTGAELDRPVLDEVRAAAARGLFQALVVYWPDRLSRDPLYLLTLVREFQNAGIALHFVEGASDDTPEGELLMYISGYVGFRERQQIAERTMRAKQRIAESGERLPNGTGSGLYGCDYDSDAKRRVLNHAEAAVVRMIFQWASEGLSCYLIAVKLNAMNIPTKRGKRWHPLGVKRILTNRAYTGVQYYGETRSRNGKGQSRNGKRRKRVITIGPCRNAAELKASPRPSLPKPSSTPFRSDWPFVKQRPLVGSVPVISSPGSPVAAAAERQSSERPYSASTAITGAGLPLQPVRRRRSVTAATCGPMIWKLWSGVRSFGPSRIPLC